MASRPSVSLSKIDKSEAWSTGTVLAITFVVRRTTLPDEHTTVAIRGTDAAAGVSVIVPSTGVDLVAVERALLQFALDTHGGNRTHAAQFLGLSRSALLYRMQKYHLVQPQPQSSTGTAGLP